MNLFPNHVVDILLRGSNNLSEGALEFRKLLLYIYKKKKKDSNARNTKINYRTVVL